MSEANPSEYIVCERTGRNCASKVSSRSEKAEAINTHTTELLNGFAERQRGLCAETTVRISLMSEQVHQDTLESPEEAQRALDEVEITIADLAVDRPVVVVACDGAKFFGGCGSYLTEG